MNPVRKTIMPNPGTVDLSLDDYRFTPSIKDIHFDAYQPKQQRIPTLSDIADQNTGSIEGTPGQPLPANATLPGIHEFLGTGTVRLSPELLLQITNEIKQEVMGEIKTLLRAAISRQVCQTVGVASKDLQKRIQGDIEASIPGLVADAMRHVAKEDKQE